MLPQENKDTQLKSTIALVDSLVAFYQQEQMWIYRTRASLENAFQNPSPMETDMARCSAPDTTAYMGYNDSASRPQHSQAGRWMRRKQDFKLRIDDIRTKYFNSQQEDQINVSDDGPLSPEKILDMFDKLVEARLESCQRVNKLVRDANLPSLQYTSER